MFLWVGALQVAFWALLPLFPLLWGKIQDDWGHVSMTLPVDKKKYSMNDERQKVQHLTDKQRNTKRISPEVLDNPRLLGVEFVALWALEHWSIQVDDVPCKKLDLDLLLACRRLGFPGLPRGS